MRDAHDIKLGRRRFRIYYSRPSFLEGIARVLDIGGTMGPRVEIISDRGDTGKSGVEQDADEIREIWAEVGQYIYDAMGTLNHAGRNGAGLNERKSASWRSPIPPPHILEQYESILPGAADRILSMAEKAQECRHNRDRINGTKSRRSEYRYDVENTEEE